MALTEVNFCLCDTGSQPHLDCVLHRVDKFYRWVQSDTVFFGTSPQRLRIVPVSSQLQYESFIWVSITEPLKLGKVITAFRFFNLSLFSCSKITPLSLAFYFSSQLYPHSYPQTLFKLEEMRTHVSCKKKKKINKKLKKGKSNQVWGDHQKVSDTQNHP